MAVGDFVLDDRPPPVILQKGLNYEKWGIGDIMKLPAGWLTKINTGLSYYHALKGYTLAAGNTAAWTKNHPEAWEMVSTVIEWRLERKQNGDSYK